MNRNIKWALICLLALAAMLAPAVSAFASEEAGHGSPVMEWVWKVVNFAILVFILVKFGGKPLKGFLEKRTELIEKSLKEAKEAKELAEKALAEVQDRLKTKDQEIAGIIAAAKESGEREKKALALEGERLSEKALEQAKTNIEYELKRAKEEIKAEAVELAMELAEKKLKQKLTPSEQEKLLEESLSKLEGRK